MKKFLSTLLALTMLLALAAPALAENPTVTYYVRGGTAQYEPYLYETLVGLQKIQEMAGVDIDWTVVCGNGDEIKAQYVAMMASGNYPDIIQWQHNNSLGYVGGVAQMYARRHHHRAERCHRPVHAQLQEAAGGKSAGRQDADG